MMDRTGASGDLVLPFPRERGLVVDSGRLGTSRHISHALLELDVTRARQYLREHKAKTGQSLSFSAYIVMCLARAIAQHRQVQAYRSWRNQMIVFQDVDVVIMIEPAENVAAIPHIIRSAHSKSLRQIHDEIRQVQAHVDKSEWHAGMTAWGLRVPSLLRMAFFWALKLNPRWFKKVCGTVVVTAVGMFGGGGGWGISFLPLHTLGVTIGGIVEKPGAVQGQIQVREYLDLTLSIDHDVVDGAPAARFVHAFRDLVESGCGIQDSE